MLDKAITAGKEHRKPYYGTQRFDRTCRCHGSCEWCKANRFYQTIRKEQEMNSKLNEYFYLTNSELCNIKDFWN